MSARPNLFFDGKTAASRAVDVLFDGERLTVIDDAAAPRVWPLRGVEWAGPEGLAQPLRLKNSAEPGTRLIIHDPVLARLLRERAPHLCPRAVPARRRFGGQVVGGLAILAALIYVTLAIAPQVLAVMVPHSWWQRAGGQAEAAFVQGARACRNPFGLAALGILTARLAEQESALPPLTVSVYDIPVLNAWTLPGGRIVLTRDLIERTDDPDEVAGVLAHEMGHVLERHPETSLIRDLGVQILSSLVSGSGGFAGTLAALRYSRDAEREADAVAQALMVKAAIDPLALRRFFARMLAEEGPAPRGAFGRLASLISTHPVTRERMAAVKPLPEGTLAVPALTGEEWLALQVICE